VAGFDKLVFLFKDNEKIDVNKTSVSFVFGNTTPVNPPCIIDPYIDPEKNTFTIPCGCTTISYQDNTFKQNCLPPPPPDCTKDIYFDPERTSFDYNCGCDTRNNSTDFLIDCTATGGGTGESIDFGIIINSYGFGSSTLFSVDIYNAEGSLGYVSDAIVNVADMRLAANFAYGQQLDVVLFKYTYLDNDFTFGHTVNTLISFDDRNYFSDDLNLSVGQNLESTVIFNPYNEFNREINSIYGYDANTLIIYDVRNPFEGEVNYTFDYSIDTFIVFDNNVFESDIIFNYSFSADATVTFDNGNNFDSPVVTTYGYSSDSFVIFDYPSSFETDIISEVGFESDTLMTYGALNPFPTIIVSDYGYSVNTTLHINLVENLVDFNKTIDFDYGYSVNTFVIFNAYNPILDENTNIDIYYGSQSDTTIRYSDDPYINNIEYNLGYISESELDTREGLYTFASDFEYGFDGEGSDLIYTVGLAATGYHGIMSNILYIANMHVPVHLDAIMGFGYAMHDNQFDGRVIDLLKKPCCTFHKNDLKNIEMTLEADYSRQWMDLDVFGCKVEVQFTTQPRFSATMTNGMTSDVVDTTSYFSVDFKHGITANVRSMNFDSTIDLVGGNFIVDQNEIKVEMTKPEDTGVTQYGMMHGFECTSLFTTIRAMGMQGEYGYYSTFDIRYESPMRPACIWGFQCNTTLNTFNRYQGESSHGMMSYTTFYEPPYNATYGFYSETSQLFTENFVEFLEDGEVRNEFIHQNENGDPDKTKPNGLTIEGYVYTHYIKGRCY